MDMLYVDFYLSENINYGFWCYGQIQFDKVKAVSHLGISFLICRFLLIFYIFNMSIMLQKGATGYRNVMVLCMTFT